MLGAVPAWLLAAALAVSYVAGVYLRPLPFPRDAPVTVVRRMQLVGAVCILQAAAVPLVLGWMDPTYSGSVHKALGLGWPLVSAMAHTVFAAVCLYACDLLWAARHPSPLVPFLHTEFATLHGFRNHVFAPVTEEAVYTALVLHVLQQSRASTAALVFGSPLLFGAAHIHHGFTVVRGGVPIAQAAVPVAFQFAYTTVFGAITKWVFLRSRSLYPCILLHTACNLGGIPATSPAPAASLGLALFAVSIASFPSTLA